MIRFCFFCKRVNSDSMPIAGQTFSNFRKFCNSLLISLFNKPVYYWTLDSLLINHKYMDSDRRKLFRRNYSLLKRNFGDLHFDQMFFGDENPSLPTYEPAWVWVNMNNRLLSFFFTVVSSKKNSPRVHHIRFDLVANTIKNELRHCLTIFIQEEHHSTHRSFPEKYSLV